MDHCLTGGKFHKINVFKDVVCKLPLSLKDLLTQKLDKERNACNETKEQITPLKQGHKNNEPNEDIKRCTLLCASTKII